jgi:hypothetical protein
MDIGWCKKDNIWDQLRTEMREIAEERKIFHG